MAAEREEETDSARAVLALLAVVRLVGEQLVVQVAASLEAADMLEGGTQVVA